MGASGRLLGALGAAFLALIAPGAATAQTSRLAVYIDSTTPDPVGQQLVFYLRDQVGRSGTFSEVDQRYDHGFKVHVVTLDPFSGTASAGTTTIYSYVITTNGGPKALDSYLTSYVGVCHVAAECAQTLFGALGQEAESIRQLLTKTGG